jgi:hypothetical protein
MSAWDWAWIIIAANLGADLIRHAARVTWSWGTNRFARWACRWRLRHGWEIRGGEWVRRPR